MPLAAAAVCPHPPLLVPALAGATAGELDPVRAACRAAIVLLFGAAPDVIVVVGAGPRTSAYPPGTRGTLRPWGVGVDVTLGAPDGSAEPADLPLSLAVGAWLLGVPPRPIRGEAVATDLPTESCAALGRDLVSGPQDVALLVMGDGSARRAGNPHAEVDPRAESFDAAAAAALRDGDPAGLLTLDPTEAAELRCAGRAAWQVLAGAALERVPPHRRLLFDAAPYGVGYFVASWT